MATQTTYFEFNKPSGADLVNPLVDTNPNWDKADAALHEQDERSIANATETVVLGVHAISRLNTSTKFIKWIATANFTAGDTFAVDGNVVAASTPSGANLETNAYVTGAVVFACLNADDSAMTIFVSGTTIASDSERLGGELPSYYATAAAMGSAQTDIGNIQALNGNTSIVGIGDGTLTGAASALNTGLSAVNTIIADRGVMELLDNSSSTVSSTKNVTLSDSIDNYKYLLITAKAASSGTNHFPKLIPVNYFALNRKCVIWYDGVVGLSAVRVDDTHITLEAMGSSSYYVDTYGIK